MNIANSHTSTRNQNYCQDLITKNSGYNKNSGSSTPLSTSTTNCVWTTKVKTQLNIASGAATGLHSERTIPLSHSECEFGIHGQWGIRGRSNLHRSRPKVSGSPITAILAEYAPNKAMEWNLPHGRALCGGGVDRVSMT